MILNLEWSYYYWKWATIYFELFFGCEHEIQLLIIVFPMQIFNIVRKWSILNMLKPCQVQTKTKKTVKLDRLIQCLGNFRIMVHLTF